MRIDNGGIGLHVTDEGEGPPVLLLHGWPDTHAMWRHQIGALVAAGHRVIAPDLRGFGQSDAPDDIAAYGLFDLVGDAVAVLDQLDVPAAHVVGHDWGAALAWALAIGLPDRVTSLTAVSVGHPASFTAAGFPQREKSWYMLLFQFPDVAETWLSADGWANFRAWIHHPEADEVAARLADPGALTATLAIYRANARPENYLSPPLELPPVVCPTLGVWSTGDPALTEAQMTGSAAHVAPGAWRYERLDGPGHWIPLEAPDRLSELIVVHVRGQG